MTYKKHLLRWLPFSLFFLYFWGNLQIFTHLPAYGDALEVVWGITWYNHALSEGISPFWYPYIFHPEGWQVGILAHTPLFFLLAQPFYLIGGEIFAYNMLAIIPAFISYIGALRFARHYTKSPLTQIAIALGFTFIILRSNRVGGHLHIWWATSFLPLIADQLLLWRDHKGESIWHQHVWLSAIYSGLAIAFSLYSVFLAPLLYLLLGHKLWHWRRTASQGIAVIIVTGAISLTALLPYLNAVRIEPTNPPVINQLVWWSANVNGVFVPSGHHSIPQIRQFSHLLTQDAFEGEANAANLGLSTLALILIGCYGLKTKKSDRTLLFIFLIPLVLSLGPYLKISGEMVSSDSFKTLNESLWLVAHWLKPETFPNREPDWLFQDSVPLPGYLFYAYVPFAESARTVARFTMLTLLGALGLVAIGLDQLPKWLKYTLLVIWLIEMLPIRVGNLPLPLDTIHPAHQWLQENTDPDEAIIDLRDSIYHGALPLYVSWEIERPTAASIGSFLPRHNQMLYRETGELHKQDVKKLANLFHTYGIHHVLVHFDRNTGDETWEHLLSDPNAFQEIGCFTPDAQEKSPWTYKICIAEVIPHPTLINLFPTHGISEPFESWGTWAIETRPRFDFIATSKASHVIVLEAFPHCIDGRTQTLQLISDEQVLYQHDWQACESIYAEIIIPAEHIEVGRNEIRFELDYAISPAELDLSNDPRPLSVGFTRMEAFKIR